MAWSVLGWEAAFFSEIEPFPCAVLAHHHPSVPNHGDMTLFQDWPDHAIDLLVGGTPCQSFSVAGLRAGLADPRGNLMLTYLALAAKSRPRWLVWENVPGVLSSNNGRDFGTFLRGLGELGYGFAYRVLDAQFCRTHGFARAVPQRRRRVFVVGYLGDWRRAAAVLFDGSSLRGDSAPLRVAGQDVAPTISARPTGGGGLGTDFDLDGGVIASIPLLDAAKGRTSDRGVRDGAAIGNPGDPMFALRAGSQHGVAVPFDTTQITSKANYSNPQPGDPSHPLASGAHPPAVAIQAGALRENVDSGPDGAGVRADGASYTIEARAEVQAVAYDMRGREGGADLEGPHDTANIRAASGGSSRSYVADWAVRRLTPTECERLQGFPDGYTAVPYRKKPATDGPRYKALGNSMAVNVMRVIGSRIALVEAA
jgi:DNA (cytosine-5)-methyltransferase 1